MQNILRIPDKESYRAARIEDLIQIINKLQNFESEGLITMQPPPARGPFDIAVAAERKDGDKARGKIHTTAERIRNTPAVVFVQTFAAETPHDSEENYAAACCAVQNLLLAAHAEGLGAIWRTGVPCEHPAVKAFLEIPADAKLVAAVFLGFPAAPAPPQTRRPLEERVRFLTE